MLDNVKQNARKTVEGLRETLKKEAEAARRLVDTENYAKLARTYQDTVKKGMHETWDTFLNTQRQVAQRLRENTHGWKDVMETLHETQKVLIDEAKQNAKTLKEIWTPLLRREQPETSADETPKEASEAESTN